MAWGSSWGTYWGGGSGDTTPPAPAVALTLTQAMANTSRSVAVTFSDPYVFVSFIGENDAANPKRWSVVNQVTGVASTVLATRALSSTVIEVRLLEPFLDQSLYLVAVDHLLSVAGGMLAEPKSAPFNGMPQAVMAPPEVGYLDIKNASNGALVMTDGGDYAHDSGDALRKKLVDRRVITPAGAFYHLPGYGVGFPEKELITISELMDSKRSIERQISQEPGIDRCIATVLPMASTTGGVVIQLAYWLSSNPEKKLTTDIPVSGTLAV